MRYTASSDVESGPYHMASKQSSPPPPSLQYFHPAPTPSKQWFPWLVPAIFAANVIMFAYSMYVNDCPTTTGDPDLCVMYNSLGRYSFQPFKENPLFGPSVTTLEKLGALEKKLMNNGEAWRLFSCIWLHMGVIHLFANMLSLMFVGMRLEKEFGFFKIGLVYMLSGFGGSLSSALHLNTNISVGASGALFGLLGAMLSELITNWTIYSNKCSAFSSLLFVIALNLAVGLIPRVDNSAHIGGFLSGFLLGFILLIRPQFGYVSRKNLPPGYDMKHLKSRHKCYQYVLCFTALVVVIIGYGSAWTKLFGFDGDLRADSN